jgi:hypothetical protein
MSAALSTCEECYIGRLAVPQRCRRLTGVENEKSRFFNAAAVWMAWVVSVFSLLAGTNSQYLLLLATRRSRLAAAALDMTSSY